jgi:hypothetical protein
MSEAVFKDAATKNTASLDKPPVPRKKVTNRLGACPTDYLGMEDPITMWESIYSGTQLLGHHLSE